MADVSSPWNDIPELKSSPGVTTRMSPGVFELFCETIPAAFVIVNFDGHLVWANDAFYRLVGHEPQQGLLPIGSLVHPEDRQRTRDEYHRLIAERGGVTDFPARCLTPQGEEVHLRWTIQVDASTRLLFCVATRH